MPQAPLLAIVVDRGLIQWLITEAWPVQIPQPRIVIVDYDIEDASPSEVTTFSIGDLKVNAMCRMAKPIPAESYENFLSPRAVLSAMGRPVDGESTPSPIMLAREMHRRVQAVHSELERHERSPTGDDYDRLHAIVSGWLIDILGVLEDRPG